MDKNKNESLFVSYDAITDNRYAGAEQVVKAELDNLKKRRNTDPENIRALALSGGGIRSASFCLGVIQSLAKSDRLKDFDYLSTVSGGGYLGGALSWAWLGKWRTDKNCTTEFGTGSDNFPYGTGFRYSNKNEEMDRNQASMMRHLRQHGKYLVPGKGITLLSFLSVILRSVSMGFVTLLVLASLLFHTLHYLTPAFKPGLVFSSYSMDAGILALTVYFLSLVSYGVFAIWHRHNEDENYVWRRGWEISIKYVLIFALTFMLIAIIDIIRIYIDSHVDSAGGISAAIGAFLAWQSQKSSKDSILKVIPKNLLVYIGVSIMFIGLFVLSDQIAVSLKEDPLTYTGHVILASIILIAAWLIPVNKVSIHRYYRDRLMETFMPDICKLFKAEGLQSSMAEQANQARLHDCLPADKNTMPYPIINTNIILVESDVPKFKGRCGDNFILSPLYSGSNATGWNKTEEFANGEMTLPTAVAISGAAANSDSGVAGQGLTVNPLISAIMSIFNLRLGYWSVNPNINYQPDQKAVPNYLRPGFRGVINRCKLNEKADFIQLSDGGHFENLAMYELIRRRCKLIICCDAEEDHSFSFNSLSNIIEKARVDFGTDISITADDLDSVKYRNIDCGDIEFAEKAYIVAPIKYPNNQTGTLIYIKSTLPDGLPADIMGYKYGHNSFPHETTADQFFDEKQIEAYRSLGFHIAESMQDDKRISWT